MRLGFIADVRSVATDTATGSESDRASPASTWREIEKFALLFTVSSEIEGQGMPLCGLNTLSVLWYEMMKVPIRQKYLHQTKLQ